jgi:hypothetical protein
MGTPMGISVRSSEAFLQLSDKCSIEIRVYARSSIASGSLIALGPLKPLRGSIAGSRGLGSNVGLGSGRGHDRSHWYCYHECQYRWVAIGYGCSRSLSSRLCQLAATIEWSKAIV